jgi:hypothetical protein
MLNVVKSAFGGKNLKLKPAFLLLTIAVLFTLYISGCNENSVTTPGDQTDNQYLQTVVQSGYSGGDRGVEDNLMANTIADLDTGAVADDGGYDIPILHLIKWGRHITDVNINLSIANMGDTMKNVVITRNITGYYRIIGIDQTGHQIEVDKPYTEVTNRDVSFKRVARTPYPKMNWRVYSISVLSGKTTYPNPTNTITLNSIVITDMTTNVVYTLNGPDFTQNVFYTKLFGGAGLPTFDRGDQIKIDVYATSTTSDTNIVAWHWARNTFGFHRIPFRMINNVPGSGGYNQTYERVFTIYNYHLPGFFNTYISGNTKESLWDDDPGKFNSMEAGIPYRISQ